MVERLAAFLVFALAVSSVGSAMTVKSRSDLRYWETVANRSTPLSWAWTDSADSARLSFSNRLTRAVTTVRVKRTAGEAYGQCPHPVFQEPNEALVVATLIQYAGGAEVSRETAELAYVSGVAGRTLTVRTKSAREWCRAKGPQMAAYDAGWWNVSGPSGYAVLWVSPPGWHRITRDFPGVGTVDEATLLFCLSGFMLTVR